MNDTPRQVEPEFTHYRRSQIANLRPYVSGETLSDRVSISAADLEAGSPKPGDMIARNPANHDDQWLVAADYFAANFEPVSAAPAPEGGAVPYDLSDLCQEVRRRYPAAFDGTDHIAKHPPSLENATDLFIAACFTALATREEAPDWTARTEAAWAENNREEAPADHVSDVRQMVEAPACKTCGGKGYTEHEGGEGEGYPSRPEIEACACRAQPPAREDAQPVAWVDPYVLHRLAEYLGGVIYPRQGRGARQPLYTRPAPDALRVAVEALDEMADTDPDDGTAWFHNRIERARRDVAALQAEQKGGAA